MVKKARQPSTPNSAIDLVSQLHPSGPRDSDSYKKHPISQQATSHPKWHRPKTSNCHPSSASPAKSATKFTHTSSAPPKQSASTASIPLSPHHPTTSGPKSTHPPSPAASSPSSSPANPSPSKHEHTSTPKTHSSSPPPHVAISIPYVAPSSIASVSRMPRSFSSCACPFRWKIPMRLCAGRRRHRR